MTKEIKNVDVLVTFNNGNVVRMRSEVPVRSYANLQSKGCTRRTVLQNKVFLKKVTPEEAKEEWDKNVIEPWNNMVVEPLKASLPESVLNEIESFEPASEMIRWSTPELDVE